MTHQSCKIGSVYKTPLVTYVDPNIKFLMYKSSFLDPRFKTLTYLSTTSREEIFDYVLGDTQQLNECVQSDSKIQIKSDTATDLESSVTPANLRPSTPTDEPTRKKKKRSALMELKFQSENKKLMTQLVLGNIEKLRCQYNMRKLS